MPGKQTEEGGSPSTPASETQANALAPAEADGQVVEALARVQEAVTDMKDGELRASLEVAIEVIDSARETSLRMDSDQLGPVADALEGALDELERGKVTNLLPVIEQAQSVVQTEPPDA
jgi:ABC-type transporter Mla subunit MlaD